MGREIDEAWIEQAIDRYQRIATLQAEFDRALTKVDVTVRSPDGLVEIVVGADGVIRDVVISEAAQGRPVRELSRAVQAAVTAAAGAAEWARARVQQDMFGFVGDLASTSAGPVTASPAGSGPVSSGGATDERPLERGGGAARRQRPAGRRRRPACGRSIRGPRPSGRAGPAG